MSYLGKTGAQPKTGLQKKAKEEVDRRGKGKSEHAIQVQCEDVLNNLHITFIRVPDAIYKSIFGSSAIRPHIKKLISSFVKGLPDITMLLRDGRYICVELKTTVGKMSQGQKTFEKKVGEENYHVIRSVEGLLDLLREYGEII